MKDLAKTFMTAILIFGLLTFGYWRGSESSCTLVHCSPEDTMKDVSVLTLEDGEALTVTRQGDDLVFTIKALSK